MILTKFQNKERHYIGVVRELGRGVATSCFYLLFNFLAKKEFSIGLGGLLW